MKLKAVEFIRGVIYTFSSNAVSLIVTAIAITIVPKVMGMDQYGYYQLFIFYSSNIVPFLHFGWINGIYLRYGGKEYDELDKSKFFSQYWMLTIFETIIAIIIYFCIKIFIKDTNKLFILEVMAIRTLIVIPREMLLIILQGSNRLKDYSSSLIIEKIVFIISTVSFILIGKIQFQWMIIAEVIGKISSAVVTIILCRDIVIRNIRSFKCNYMETIQNIKVGVKIMAAFIAGILIVAMARFAIERVWDIQTFGKVSLTLNLSNLIIIFTSAIGIVLFPVIKRVEPSRLKNIYVSIRTILMPILLAFYITFFPLKIILSNWLPNYSDSFIYMSLLFPIAIYESKMNLLINTYLKALRRENTILAINIISVIFSVILTITFTMIIKNLVLLLSSISILTAVRCITADISVSRMLKTKVIKNNIIETIITLIFMILGWYMSTITGFYLFVLVFVLYFLYDFKEIKNEYFNLKKYLY